MADPFRIEGPAVISFSGGRTSAYMLWRILNAGLQPDVHVLFANTGKERIETLHFVHEIETRWAPVHWLEYLVTSDDPRGHGREVTYETASRDGTPFASLNSRNTQGVGLRFLPNPVQRICTQELKIRPMRDWMLAHGYEHWTNVVGIRADEPRRVAKMRSPDRKKERWEIDLPLADAGIALPEIMAFWKTQPFDLQLRPHEGNCDLCFLKGTAKLVNIVRDRPDLAQWWANQEAEAGATFRKDRPSYAAMLAQPDLFVEADEDDLVECHCHD